MASRCPQKTHVYHFRAFSENDPGGFQKVNFVGIKFHQEALKSLICIFGSRAPNGPKDTQKVHFEYFRAAGVKWYQEALRTLMLSISANGRHCPQEALRISL